MLIAEAQRLRSEAAQLEEEQEQARKMLQVLELVMCKSSEPEPNTFIRPAQQLEQDMTAASDVPVADAETESASDCRQSAEQPVDLDTIQDTRQLNSLSTRLLATLPYLLPVLDAWRFFGVGVVSECWPTYYMAWMALAAMVPQDFHELCITLQPLLLFAMPTVAVQRRLPQLLRFNLNQAFVLDLATCLAFHTSSCIRWLSLTAAGDDAIYVPEAAEPPLMPCGQAIFILLMACTAYSACTTLCVGSLPDRIPYVSAEARKSLGTSMTVPKNRKSNSRGR